MVYSVVIRQTLQQKIFVCDTQCHRACGLCNRIQACMYANNVLFVSGCMLTYVIQRSWTSKLFLIL